MKSSIEFQGTNQAQQIETKARQPVSRRVRGIVGAVAAVSTVVGLPVVAGAQTPNKHPVVNHPSGHGRPKHHAKHHKAHKPTHPTTTTTTTTQPWVATPNQSTQASLYPSNMYLGGAIIKRLSPLEANQSDDMVVHSLHAGQWVSPSDPNQGVDDTPELDNGPVYDQSSAFFGTKGESTIVSAHDVTPIHDQVVYNGTPYNQQEMTASTNVEPDPNNPNGGQGNLIVGDELQFIVNGPSNSETTYTYQIQSRNVISASDNAAIQALDNPPSSRDVNQIVWYDCWEPHGDAYREVYRGPLINVQTGTSQVIESSPSSPNENAINQ